MSLRRLACLLLAALLTQPVWAEESVRLGFLYSVRREMSRTDVRASFDLWVQELAASFQIPVKVTYYDDIEQMKQDFRQGRINGVTAEAMALTRNFRLDELAEGYSVAMPGGWNIQLLTAKGAGIHGPQDLAGKRVALIEDDPVMEQYLETLCLRHHARPCQEVLGEIQRLPNNNQALMRLFFGKADAALLYRYGYELAREMNPQVARKVAGVVAELPLKGLYYAFYSAKVDKAFRQRTLRVIPTLHQYPRGRQLLDVFKMDHLDIAEPAELKPFLQLDRDYRELKAQYERGGGRR